MINEWLSGNLEYFFLSSLFIEYVAVVEVTKRVPRILESDATGRGNRDTVEKPFNMSELQSKCRSHSYIDLEGLRLFLSLLGALGRIGDEAWTRWIFRNMR